MAQANARDQRPHWLYRPENRRKLWWVLGVILVLAVVPEFFVHHHAHFAEQGIGVDASFGFYAWYGRAGRKAGAAHLTIQARFNAATPARPRRERLVSCPIDNFLNADADFCAWQGALTSNSTAIARKCNAARREKTPRILEVICGTRH